MITSSAKNVVAIVAQLKLISNSLVAENICSPLLCCNQYSNINNIAVVVVNAKIAFVIVLLNW